MHKKILCLLTALFFGLMLFGTLFHQKIDGIFREHVKVVKPKPYKEMVTQTWEKNGEEHEIITEETFLLIPKEAVQYNMVYVLETVEVPYGSYEVVRLKGVETAGETGDCVKVRRGLKERDRVVSVFGESLENEERVVASVIDDEIICYNEECYYLEDR